MRPIYATTSPNGLRPYQKELLDKTRAALQHTDKPVMMQLPTGGGKTVIAGALLSKYLIGGRKAVWITHRRELMSQTLERFREAVDINASAPNWPTNEVAPHQRNGVVILMAQTAGKRSDQSYIPEDWLSYIWSQYGSNDLMIVDEAHHATAPSWERAIRQWPGKVMGMTATPWRLSKNEGFDHLFGELVLGPQVRKLQKDGFLCPANVLVPDVEERILGGNVPSHLDYNPKSIEAANANKDVMTARALKFWQEHAENRQTIIYAVSIGHAENLAALFQEAGVSAEVIHSKTDQDRRFNAIDNFGNGNLSVLINVAIATEGFDVPDASCIVIARPTKSLSLYLQMVGRGLRPKDDGGNCIILDLASNARKHGLPEFHREWSLAARDASEDERDAPVVTCDECRTVSPAASHNCKSCGAPLGKDCPGCKWRAWKDWTLENCEYSHERVGNCCHLDVHVRYGNPVAPLFLRKFKSDIDSLGEGQFVFENPNIVTDSLLDVLKEMGGKGPSGEVIGRVRRMLWTMDCKRLGFVKNEGDLEKSYSDHTKDILKLFQSNQAEQIRLAKVKELTLRQAYGDISSHRSVKSSTTIYKKITAAHEALLDSEHCIRDPYSKIWHLTDSGHARAQNILLQTPSGD